MKVPEPIAWLRRLPGQAAADPPDPYAGWVRVREPNLGTIAYHHRSGAYVLVRTAPGEPRRWQWRAPNGMEADGESPEGGDLDDVLAFCMTSALGYDMVRVGDHVCWRQHGGPPRRPHATYMAAVWDALRHAEAERDP